MAAPNLEERIISLEKKISRLKKLEQEVIRLKGVNEIQNLMGRYEYLLLVSNYSAIIDLYAKKSPDLFVAIGVRGHWVGKDAPRRAWENFVRRPRNPGDLSFHPINTPVIEVAGDGKTAKAVWIATGLSSKKDPETGKAVCTWEWDRYGVDFIKEDGKWKFWHFHVYRLFRCGWDDKWADQFSQSHQPVSILNYTDETKPDGPPIDSYPYTLDTLPKNIPAPPEPYESWDEKTSYGKIIK
jgi:hypothetical protein